jgi:hypothetical protein
MPWLGHTSISTNGETVESTINQTGQGTTRPTAPLAFTASLLPLLVFT